MCLYACVSLYAVTVQWPWKGECLLQWTCHKKAELKTQHVYSQHPLTTQCTLEHRCVCVCVTICMNCYCYFMCICVLELELYYSSLGTHWFPLSDSTPWEHLLVSYTDAHTHTHTLLQIIQVTTHTETQTHSCTQFFLCGPAICIFLQSTLEERNPKGPESVSLFIHPMSDIDKMTCGHTNTFQALPISWLLTDTLQIWRSTVSTCSVPYKIL